MEIEKACSGRNWPIIHYYTVRERDVCTKQQHEMLSRIGSV